MGSQIRPVRRVRRLLAAVTVLAAGLAGVVVVPGASATPAQGSGGGKASWTILNFINADTSNIEESLLFDLVEPMTETGSTPDVNVVALVDRTPDQYNGPLLNIPDFTTGKLLKAEQGSFTELQDVGEIDMGDPQTLAWFVANGMQQFPAEHYAVVIADHGGGIDGSSWDDSSPRDENGHASNLTIDEVTVGLQAALRDTGEDRIDLVTYAACLMATYDAGAKLAPVADYMLASEEVSYGVQWNMSGMLERLTADPSMTGADIGAEFVDLTEQTDWFAERTMSVLDLRGIDRVTQALESFAFAVENDLEATATALGRAQSATLNFGVVGQDRDYYHLYDIGDLMAHLEGVSPEVETARNALYQAATTVVVDQANGPGASQATGLSVYFPATADDFQPEYRAMAAAPGWVRMLDAYFGLAQDNGGANGSAPQFESPNLTLEQVADGVLASADLVAGTETSVVGADMLAGRILGDGSTAYLIVAPATIGAGGVRTIAAGWDYSYGQLTDGDATLDATVLISPVENGLRYTIPVLYQDAAGQQSEAAIQLLFDAAGQPMGDPILLQFEQDGGVSQIEPSPGSLLAPEVYVVEPGGVGGYQLLSDQGIDATTFRLAGSLLPSGTQIALTMVAFDAADNQAVASGTALVP